MFPRWRCVHFSWLPVFLPSCPFLLYTLHNMLVLPTCVGLARLDIRIAVKWRIFGLLASKQAQSWGKNGSCTKKSPSSSASRVNFIAKMTEKLVPPHARGGNRWSPLLTGLPNSAYVKQKITRRRSAFRIRADIIERFSDALQPLHLLLYTLSQQASQKKTHRGACLPAYTK